MTTNLPMLLAAALLATLAIPPAPAQAPAEEVLCPVFIPEAPVKYCITITGSGCVHVTLRTFGIPTEPSVSRKACPLP